MSEKACWCSKWAGYIESRKEPWKYVRDRIPLWCIVKQILSVRGSIPLHTTILLILNVINMVKLKRLSVEKIDPSINRKGQVEILFHDCYLRKDQIGGVIMINDEHSINNNWADKEVKNYCKNNNLRLCRILTIGNMPDCNNIVVDETVKDLIKYL